MNCSLITQNRLFVILPALLQDAPVTEKHRVPFSVDAICAKRGKGEGSGNV